MQIARRIAHSRSREEEPFPLPSFSLRVKGINGANLIHHFHAFDALSASSVIFHPLPVAAKEKKSSLCRWREKSNISPQQIWKVAVSSFLFRSLRFKLEKSTAGRPRSPPRSLCTPSLRYRISVSTALYVYREAIYASLLALYTNMKRGARVRGARR